MQTERFKKSSIKTKGLKMRRKNEKNDEIPKLKSKEFKYIRENAGITQESFARHMGKSSKGTIWHWETQRLMKPYQVKGLIDMIGRDLFDACRKMWADWQEEKRINNENHAKYMAELRQGVNK